MAPEGFWELSVVCSPKHFGYWIMLLLVVHYLSFSWVIPVQCRCRITSLGKRTVGESVCYPCLNRVEVVGVVGKHTPEEDFLDGLMSGEGGWGCTHPGRALSRGTVQGGQAEDCWSRRAVEGWRRRRRVWEGGRRGPCGKALKSSTGLRWKGKQGVFDSLEKVLLFLLMFLLFDKSGHVCWYSGVKSLCVCVDLGSLRAVRAEANCSLAQKMGPCFCFYAVCFSVVFSLPQIRCRLNPVAPHSVQSDIVF